jgi:hypothetical protein
MLDATSVDDRTSLLAQAARLRRLARDIMDPDAERVLLDMASEYEQRAAANQDIGGNQAECGSNTG